MPATAGYLTVMLEVRDIARSIAFYSLFGFELIDADREGARIVWARMHCEGGGAIMFITAEDETPASTRMYMYMYTSDLLALREQLIAAGVAAAEIAHPPYMRSGEMCVADPDGNAVFVGHWGTEEHEAWERQRQEKRAAGLI